MRLRRFGLAAAVFEIYVVRPGYYVQAQRFFIEHSFREAKSECGMADYQVRRWDAWHRHMELVKLGTLFLVK